MSTAVESIDKAPQESTQNVPSVDALADALEETALQGDAGDTQVVAKAEGPETRSRIVYTRKHLIHLSQSPLVKVPDGMPAFKSWFGDWNEQSLQAKKESESLNVNGAPRDRRYRREAEDGDGSSRPPFRSALSQPSQMGNFKHQPLRASDRDRDTERDLRSLSDRYDRDRATRGDRMGVPSHSTLLRNRDRDSAPHLVSDRDAQRLAVRKRNGESKEDWRRGAEPPRAGRDENNSRRERDDRERQRSRARDSSRPRDSPPSGRRDRDRDRFNETDEDPKRWREEGKRDDRLQSRRAGREKGDLVEDRESWSTADDKKRGARDRRYDDVRDKEDKKEREKEKEPAWMETYIPPTASSTGILGGKGGEGEMDSIQAWKKDMKEREMKAKGLASDQSASASSASQDAAGGPEKTKTTGTASEGQLDEIQLFKLMMKKEEQKRSASGESKNTSDGGPLVSGAGLRVSETGLPGPVKLAEGQAGTGTSGTDRPGSLNAVNPETGLSGVIDPLLASKSAISLKTTISANPSVPSPSSLPGLGAPSNPTSNAHTPTSVRPENNGPRLLSLKTPDSATFHGDLANKDAPSSATVFEPPRQSRLLAFGAQNTKAPAQPSPQSAAAAVQMGRLQQMDPLGPNQRRPSASPAMPLSASQQTAIDRANLQQQLLASGQLDMNIAEHVSRRSVPESAGHNPLAFDNATRSVGLMEVNKEFHNGDALRSSVPLSASERGAFSSQADSLLHLSDVRRNLTPPTASYGVTSPISPFESQMNGGQTTYSSGKGSRMAKHFEKQRDPVMNVGRNVPNVGMGTNSMAPNRQEQQTLNTQAGSGENRNIQDLLTMLNNSAQAQRGQLNPILGNHQSQSLHISSLNNSLSRHDLLLDPDEGRFAPDGLVPGLRPATLPGPRNREVNNGSLYASQLEDPLAFNARLGPQQRGGVEQLFASQLPTQFNGQGMNGGRGSGIPFQQQAMRNGPSPINNFNPIQGPPQQRLPPGLANLGGRPPHEPSQFIGGGGGGNFGGVPSQIPAGLQHANNPQSFNQFQNPNLGLLGNQGHLRGQPGFAQLGNTVGNNLNGMDFRGGPGGPPQNQMLGLGGPNLGQAMRGGPGFNAQQLLGPNQLPPSINVRQQQNMQPQMLQQMLPQHLQSVPQNQHNPTDLMALLMGGAHRE
ncbi:uncharacterized protein FOMMEDRAFT_146175 [Fomitiporia mediterranea MF3/22]|uniref:uncharacterized protein n=1 Tax=Fomitiporia mediterranea (strain MF3/22) TaxID=694068 RepID=UPI0004409CD1|nr:uncharacterized protein FOMMEDRAFT_146175 [Fomitiporia mediterranea MF3/22]EJD04137.1 hypothetical protein FOMMEDRAFT_146175 [Fomitiporia mediterranea MF3/22]